MLISTSPIQVWAFFLQGKSFGRKAEVPTILCLGELAFSQSPRLRDLHEYLLVFVKEQFSTALIGTRDISREEFMSSYTFSLGDSTESAKRLGIRPPSL